MELLSVHSRNCSSQVDSGYSLSSFHIGSDNYYSYQWHLISQLSDGLTLYPVTTPFCSSGSSHWMTMVLEERGLTCTLRGADPGPEIILLIMLLKYFLSTYFHLQEPSHQALDKKLMIRKVCYRMQK